MKTPNWLVRTLIPLLVISQIGVVRNAGGAAVLITPKEQGEGNVREYFSSNREKRFLIRIHMWGDVGQAGVYYIPDNTTLLDALGYAGGATGVLKDTEISLSRVFESKDGKSKPSEQLIKLEGDQLVQRVEYRDMVLRNGDVIHLDSPPKTDNFMRTLSVVSAVLGILTASIGIYLATKR